MVNRKYYPNGLPYIVEDRINGIRKGIVYIYGTAVQKISTIQYNNEGQIIIIEYFQNNKLHNEHGPAFISWYYDGRIYFIAYKQNGRLHDLHCPAFMSWNDNAQPYFIEYRQNDKLHNLHGPAYMNWHDGKIRYIHFYHFDKLIKKYDF